MWEIPEMDIITHAQHRKHLYAKRFSRIAKAVRSPSAFRAPKNNCNPATCLVHGESVSLHHTKPQAHLINLLYTLRGVLQVNDFNVIDGRPVQFDLWSYASPSSPQPAFVYFHGGGLTGLFE